MRRALTSLIAFVAFPLALSADDWPQWLGPKRDGVWRENGIVEKFPKEGPEVLWRTKIGEGYAGPAVADGKVFVMDRILAKGAKNPKSGFPRSGADGVERLLCLDEKVGSILWKKEYDCRYRIAYASGPRCTPAVTKDKVYALGAVGHLTCFDIKNGDILWQKDLCKEYDFDPPLWGFAGHPLVDGNRIICLVGGKESVFVAFDKNSGKELWKALSAKEPGYAPPVIYDIGGKRQLIAWHPESVNSLDPETGKLYWSVPFIGKGTKGQLGAGMSIPTPRLFGDHLFLTCFYDGSLMLKLNGTEKPTIAWKVGGTGVEPEQTEGLHAVMVTPVYKDGHIYGVCSYGEMRCLKADSGERVWKTHQFTTGKSTRWGNAFIIEQGDRYFLFNEQGDLIIAKFSPKGHEEISRAHILDPTNTMAPPEGRRVLWSHPAFANRHMYVRNDEEIICVSLAASKQK